MKFYTKFLIISLVLSANLAFLYGSPSMECFPVSTFDRTPIGTCGLTQNAIFLPNFLPETFATIELCQQRCLSTQSCQVYIEINGCILITKYLNIKCLIFFSISFGKKRLHSAFLVPHVQDQRRISKDSRVETELLYYHQIPSMLVKL